MNTIPFVIENALDFAILFAGIWLIKKLFHNKMSAQLHFLIWGIVVLKLLIPFGLPSEASPRAWLGGQAVRAAAQNNYEAYAPSTAESGSAFENADSDKANNIVSGSQTLTPINESTAVEPISRMSVRIDWNVIIISVWLLGIAARLAWLGLKSRRFRKKLLINEISPPSWVRECFDSCLREIGITKEVRLVIQDAFPVPAVTGFKKPVLILPREILQDRNRERLRHVMIHEMSHIVRKDTFVVSLLNILSAVYWFNPLVWLCIKLIRTDMETACDCMAIKALGKEKRQGYIETVIQFAGRNDSPWLRAAMGINDGHGSMERRIRGMFMRTKTKGRIKVPVVILACILVFACFTTACQPAAETPLIADGENNSLEKLIASSAVSREASPLAESADAPETYKDSYANEKGDVTVTIDAKVEMPPVDALPAVQVKVCGFTQEKVDRLAEYFLKGAPIFTEDMSVQTKEEIQLQMVGARGQQYEELEKQYKEAPEQRERTPSTTKLVESQYGTDLWIFAELGKDEAAEFCVSNYKEDFYTFSFRNDGKGSYEAIPYETENQGEAPRGMETTLEDAKTAVMECLSGLGIDDMQIESVKTATFYTDWNKMHNKDYKATAKQCYAFTLVRLVGGVPLTNISGSSQLETDDPNVPAPKEPEYNCIREPETLEIYVDDTGIVRVEWRNPFEEAAVLSEHVTLMPFDDIVQRAKENMFFKNYTAYGSTAEIKITSIRLGMMRIALKDKPGEYLIVPVWDFIGNIKFSFDDHEDVEPYEDSFVTINAIDGSMIHRNWGY